MNYELAKKLKDAGFPWQDRNVLTSSSYPTLSELIEACGSEFISLQNKNLLGWYSVANTQSGIKTGEGSTPEEAVANLWLALIPDTK